MKKNSICSATGSCKRQQKYSDETQKLLKAMMDECHLSMTTRKELYKCITNGTPLPVLKTQPSGVPQNHKERYKGTEHKSRPVICMHRRRTRDTMAEMGAFEQEKAQPLNNEPAYPDKKKRLQNLMAYGTVAPQNTDRSGYHKASHYHTMQFNDRDRFEELIEEVRDRCQFLQDLAELGQVDRYRAVMESEISAKLQAMRTLDPLRYEEVKKQLRLPLIKTRKVTHQNDSVIKLAIRDKTE